jgi:beta-phosphoglucomutase-like phosphatase (HAD superfamily)
VPPIEGGIDLVRYFRKQGLNVLLASSATTITIDAVIKNFGWETDFDFIVSSDDIKNSKPAPDTFLKAAELAGEDPSRCVVIEDSANGVKAAKRAGAHCIGYQNDLAPHQDLSEADMIVESLDKIRMHTLQQL